MCCHIKMVILSSHNIILKLIKEKKINNFTTKIFAYLDVWRLSRRCTSDVDCFTDLVYRGEFNNASARRALVDWYLSLFIMCKAGHQYNERPRALALLNLPQVVQQSTLDADKMLPLI